MSWPEREAGPRRIMSLSNDYGNRRITEMFLYPPIWEFPTQAPVSVATPICIIEGGHVPATRKKAGSGSLFSAEANSDCSSHKTGSTHKIWSRHPKEEGHIYQFHAQAQPTSVD